MNNLFSRINWCLSQVYHTSPHPTQPQSSPPLLTSSLPVLPLWHNPHYLFMLKSPCVVALWESEPCTQIEDEQKQSSTVHICLTFHWGWASEAVWWMCEWWCNGGMLSEDVYWLCVCEKESLRSAAIQLHSHTASLCPCLYLCVHV